MMVHISRPRKVVPGQSVHVRCIAILSGWSIGMRRGKGRRRCRLCSRRVSVKVRGRCCMCQDSSIRGGAAVCSSLLSSACSAVARSGKIAIEGASTTVAPTAAGTPAVPEIRTSPTRYHRSRRIGAVDCSKLNDVAITTSRPNLRAGISTIRGGVESIVRRRGSSSTCRGSCRCRRRMSAVGTECRGSWLLTKTMIKVIIRRWEPIHIHQIFSLKVVVMVGNHIHLIAIVISGGISSNGGSGCLGLGLSLLLLRWWDRFCQHFIGIHRQGSTTEFISSWGGRWVCQHLIRRGQGAPVSSGGAESIRSGGVGAGMAIVGAAIDILLLIVHVLCANILRGSHIPIATTTIRRCGCRLTRMRVTITVHMFVHFLLLLCLPSLGWRQLRRCILQRLRLAVNFHAQGSFVPIRSPSVLSCPCVAAGQPPDLSLHVVNVAVEALQFLFEAPHLRSDLLHLLSQRLETQPLGVALRFQGR
mmetsp:Transcript_34480/g.101321  ORF Transcript_34480/g.101321 Transcript_34480/m.101321 type:complete len:473 (+) Transcript_34480:2017-3435(+)